MLKVPVLIEGVRVRLRRATPEDAPALYALADDDDVMRHLDWPRMTSPEQARQHLQAVDARWDAGTEHQWVVQHKASGDLVGTVSCRFNPGNRHSVDFGCFFGRAFWGQGLAIESVRLVLGWLQRQPAVVRIWATCDADNHRSAALLQKLGLQPEGVMKKAMLRPNRGTGPAMPFDAALFAWVRPD
jgi:[ribosomal protein S5]-alanine N-acetyltransferase